MSVCVCWCMCVRAIMLGGCFVTELLFRWWDFFAFSVLKVYLGRTVSISFFLLEKCPNRGLSFIRDPNNLIWNPYFGPIFDRGGTGFILKYAQKRGVDDFGTQIQSRYMISRTF